MTINKLTKDDLKKFAIVRWLKKLERWETVPKAELTKLQIKAIIEELEKKYKFKYIVKKLKEVLNEKIR